MKLLIYGLVFLVGILLTWARTWGRADVNVVADTDILICESGQKTPIGKASDIGHGSHHAGSISLRLHCCHRTLWGSIEFATDLGNLHLPLVAGTDQHLGGRVLCVQARKSSPRPEAEHGMESLLR